MTPEQLTLRKPVWIATADLFLDTDVRLWYFSAARVAADSPFTLDELDLIFSDEVAPVACVNLLSIAGEWAGFDEDWLVSSILSHLANATRRRHTETTKDWQNVRVLIRSLRALPVDARPRRVALWQQLSKLFFDRAPAEPRLESWTPAELDPVWRDDMWPAYGPAVDIYHAQSPRSYPSRAEIDAAWTRLRNALS